MSWFKVLDGSGEIVTLLHLPAGEEENQQVAPGHSIVEIDEEEGSALRQQALLRSLEGDA